MNGLNLLPEEILLMIILNIPHNFLPALGQCSHKFQRLILSQLYRCVFFDGSKCERTDPKSLNVFRKWKGSLPIWKPSDRFLPPHEPSEIFKLDSFLRSISNSQYLRSLVEVASFGWFSEFYTLPEVGDLQNVDSIVLDLLPSLQSLSISAILPPAAIDPFMELRLTTLALYYNDFGDQSITMMDLYLIFHIETLRHLTLDGVNHVGIRTGVARRFKFEGSVSNLISLTISRIEVPVRLFLEYIIGWPKALEKLDLKFDPEHHWWFSVGDPIYPVRRQRKSLKELHISALYEPPFPSRGDLLANDPAKHRPFDELKRLRIPLEHLMVTKLYMELDSHPEGSDFSRQILYDTIPHGLEELIIECPQETEDERSQFAYDLASWQKDIWRYQAYYPNLSKVRCVLRNLEGA